MPDGKVVKRAIFERFESVLVLHIGKQQNVMLIEECDFGVYVWQLTLQGEKVIISAPKRDIEADVN